MVALAMGRRRQKDRKGTHRLTLIDVPMAAVLLGCSPQHVRNLIRKGVIANHGTRKEFQVDLHELTAKVKDGTVTPNPSKKGEA